MFRLPCLVVVKGQRSRPLETKMSKRAYMTYREGPLSYRPTMHLIFFYRIDLPADDGNYIAFHMNGLVYRVGHCVLRL